MSPELEVLPTLALAGSAYITQHDVCARIKQVIGTAVQYDTVERKTICRRGGVVSIVYFNKDIRRYFWFLSCFFSCWFSCIFAACT